MTTQGIYDRNGEALGYLQGTRLYDLNGTRIGELTASPDGTAYAVTFSDISKEWSISRIDF